MAAKPPKPPVNFLKSSQNQHSNQNLLQQKQNSNSAEEECNNPKYESDVADNVSYIQETDNNYCGNLITATNKATNNAELSTDANRTNTPSTEIRTLISCPTETQTGSAPLLNKESNCNCSNISIMHLFHEMKQEFPTIPDTIVAQCVNKNCHQRENCMQMLKNELELNPIPAQSYPAKVLHPRNSSNINSDNNNQNINNTITTKPSTLQRQPLQQKTSIVQQKPPFKPIKPTRTAPLHPPTQQQQINLGNANKIYSTNAINTTTNNIKQLPSSEDKESILNTTPSTVIANTLEVHNNTNNHSIGESVGVSNNDESVDRNLPRQRPTTLNLNTQLQKKQQQQKQLLNVQLQQRFLEQRYKQQQEQQKINQNTNVYHTKPLRKAPLPPIAPKPAQFQVNQNTNSFLKDSPTASNHQHTTTTATSSPLSESEISVSISLSTPSPTSSTPSSNNYNAIHHKYNTSTRTPSPTQTSQQHLQIKSPIRHRSVITLQPEPPHTRGFLYSSANSSLTPPVSPSSSNAIQTTSSNPSPTYSAAGSHKSYTSVNLTLRPPVSPTSDNPALQPSTIDITAGPGFSGASGGGKSLHYCSTSYDARLGYQQNFQITVTDEGGVFSACRILPQQIKQRSLNQVNINENQSIKNAGIANSNYINSFLNNNANSNDDEKHQQQFHNNNVVTLQQNIENNIQSPQGIECVKATASENENIGGVGIGTKDNKKGNMCLPPQQAVDDFTTETLQRQKKRRDRLAEALRARKKTLSQVEQDINLLTGHIPTEGLSERLDEEIRKLRRDCEAMLRNSSNFTQPPTQPDLSINHQPQQQQQRYRQPQPFPRQRFNRAPPRPPPPRQTSLDIIQHHSPTSSSTHFTPSSTSSPNLNFYNTSTPHQHQYQQQQLPQSCTSLPPSYYNEESAPYPTTVQNDLLYTAEHNGRDENDLDQVDDDGDDYEYEEEMFEPWECSMCTFRNHPQLNICETCENVRILPGTLPNLSRALSTTTNCSNTSANVATAAAFSDRPTNNVIDGNSSSIISRSASGGSNVANGNLEHDTNLVQQQLQHFALHT